MQKSCTQCTQQFKITPEDLKFYDKVSPVFNGKKYSITAPDECPQCRYKHRLFFRNERNLYYRKCDATGKSIVSIFSPENSTTVYSQDYWWSDKWDPKDYGKDFDFTRSFFEQWGELFKKVPQLALNNSRSENSEFTNQCEGNKNCYLVVASSLSEDCLYGMWMQKCTDCMDNLYLSQSELCYEIVNGEKCYSCTWSQNLENCTDCHFCTNCVGCSDCIGCTNLRNKKYHIFNKPYSREEYQTKKAELELDKYSNIQATITKAKQFALQHPSKFYQGSQNENYSGDYLHQTKNSHDSYNCRYSENIKYCTDAWEARNCQDLTETLATDYCYFVEGSAYANHDFFSMKVKETGDLIYCSHCFSSTDLFGCVGMKNAKYCILNKQYTQEEYEKLVPQIIEHMQKPTDTAGQTGEWGKYFPVKYTQFAYNETVAQEYFPLNKEQAKKAGFSWKVKDQLNSYQGADPQLPETIAEVDDSMTKRDLLCESCGNNYRIIAQEQQFYKKLNIPIPRKCSDCRHLQRMNLRNPRKLHQRTCTNCSTEISTTYSLDRPEKVYCESCYLKEVY